MPDRDGGLGTERAAVGAVGRGSGGGRRAWSPACLTSLSGSHVPPLGPWRFAVIQSLEHSRRPAKQVLVVTQDTNCALVFKVRFGGQCPGQSSSASPPPPPAQPPTCQTQHGETGNFPSQPGTLARMGTPWRPGRHVSAPRLCSPALTPPNHKRLSHSGPSAFGVATSGACGIPPTFSATSSRPGWPTQCPAHVAAQGAEMLARGPTGPGRVGGPEAGSCRPPGEAGEAQPHPARGQRPAAWHPARPHFSLRLRTQQDARFKQLPERA